MVSSPHGAGRLSRVVDGSALAHGSRRDAGDVARAAGGSVTPVGVEAGSKRLFVWAMDWPGWCRSGKTEEAALEALAAAAPRYAAVATEAGLRFPRTAAASFDVVERVEGTATTDFGAPGSLAAADAEPLTKAGAERQASLVEASWAVFDRVVAGAPAELRKGPRGGGRDRDKIVEHVLGAEAAYARKIGIRVRQPQADDAGAVAAMRAAITDFLRQARQGTPPVDKGWPPRYAARRIAWHALDHAWEIEDRSEPPG
jgi:hypothetical protein